MSAFPFMGSFEEAIAMQCVSSLLNDAQLASRSDPPTSKVFRSLFFNCYVKMLVALHHPPIQNLHSHAISISGLCQMNLLWITPFHRSIPGAALSVCVLAPQGKAHSWPLHSHGGHRGSVSEGPLCFVCQPLEV